MCSSIARSGAAFFKKAESEGLKLGKGKRMEEDCGDFGRGEKVERVTGAGLWGCIFI